MFNLLRDNGYTFYKIAKLFNLHHATVIHGINRYKDLLKVKDVKLRVDTESYLNAFKNIEAAVVKYNLEKDVRKATTIKDLDIIKRRLENGMYKDY